MILGHCDPMVDQAVWESISRLDLVGVGVTEPEIRLAETIQELVPSAERVVLANSGSEATYVALRLARAITDRRRIIKFQGAYHGWHDAVLMNVISPPDKIGMQDLLSLGMLPEVTANTVVLPFNDINAVRETMNRQGEEIAAILVEVIPHNVGCILPSVEFLRTLRELADSYRTVLVFDEVITGFRHALGGYQSIVGVLPDVTVFAKAMANGFPIAAIVGRADFLERFAPGGGVFHAGTYNGHPASVAAALATIDRLSTGDVHRHTFRLGDRLALGLQGIAAELGIPMTVAHFGSVVVPYFFAGKVETYTDLLANDTALDVWFRESMCAAGIFMLPTALKRNHISAAHTDADIDFTLETARAVLRKAPAKAPVA
ncbi:MAG: aspartate aminotransferase family protein [Isosphaeraceae bacterium]